MYHKLGNSDTKAKLLLDIAIGIMTRREIAAKYGVSPQTVAYHQTRNWSKIRELMAEISNARNSK